MKHSILPPFAFRALLSGVMAMALTSGCLSSKPRIKPVAPPPPVTLKSPAPAVATTPSAALPAPKAASSGRSVARPDQDLFPAVNIPGKVHIVESPKPAPKPATKPVPKPVPVAASAPVIPAPDRPTIPAAKPGTVADPAPVPPMAAPVSSDATSSNIYRLRPGDQVVITIRGAQNQGIDDVVDENGMITLTYLGDFKVDGLTASDVERKVRDAYINGGIFKEIYVTAFIPTRRYTVSGEVKTQGPSPINGRVTLLQAIPAAGGFTEFANKKRIVITRTRKGTQITVDYVDIQRNPEKDIEIEPDDVITVPRDSFGLFNSP